MGTNCCTVVKDHGEPLVFLWRHYDGYPEGHGEELKEFLAGFKIVNGIPMGYKGKLANGMDCLAAQMVSHFKTGPGGFYLTSPCTPKDVYYFYEVYKKGKSIFIKTYADGKKISDINVNARKKRSVKK